MPEMTDFIGELEFAANGKGNDPLQRFPWGSRMADGFQFFIDTDGFPVVTADGHLVHYDDTQQHVAVVA